MSRAPFLIVAALMAPLAACGEGTAPVIVPGASPQAPVEAAGLRLSGSAPPNARIRLATPAGETAFADADAKGLWTLKLAGSTAARIYGLSAVSGARTAQGEGYVLITPQGEPVLLRAGAGALRIGARGPNGLDAVDFDREGGAVVSGRAPAGAALSVHIDGRQTADGRADSSGRYAIALTQPIPPGAHQIDVFGDATENAVTIDSAAAPPMADGPFRAVQVASGLRIDWMTPGGGAQSTLLLK
ncbi:hypothetical protein [Phenylobacterium sp.]|uniref:hypothetical protein n=1 Tax=Phenylobacterium sp. TaxID=1871053 RepID=UPI00286C3534|nr:hypothetical protein [Phenylobacterium sp.]